MSSVAKLVLVETKTVGFTLSWLLGKSWPLKVWIQILNVTPRTLMKNGGVLLAVDEACAKELPIVIVRPDACGADC